MKSKPPVMFDVISHALWLDLYFNQLTEIYF